MGNRLQLVATAHATACNWLHAVAVAVVWLRRIFWTGHGPVVPKKAKKPDRTGLWNTNSKSLMLDMMGLGMDA